MDSIKGKWVLASAIACALGLSVSQVSIAASDVDINSASTTNMDSLGAGLYESNADEASLNIGTISDIWDSEFAPYATISTGNTSGVELGEINLDAVLDFNGYTEALVLNSHDAININANIFDSNAATDDRLTLILQPGGNTGSPLSTAVVNLNASIGIATDTEITGDLVIGSAGTYNLINEADSLSAGSITNTLGGTFNYTAGSLTISDVLNIDSTGLLGDYVYLGSTKYLQTAGQVVSNGSTLVQTFGSNTSTDGLTIDAGGSYSLSAGSLTLSGSSNGDADVHGNLLQTGGDITIEDRLAVYSDGSYTLDSGTLDVKDFGSQGNVIQNGGAITVTNEFGVDGYTLNDGTVDADQVSISGLIQNGGVITAINDFGVSSGGSYTLNSGTVNAGTVTNAGDINLTGATSIDVAGISSPGVVIATNSVSNSGNLNVDSLQVENNAVFTGAGTVNAAGDITDLRTSGAVDASYNGANISLVADTMNGAINASDSISLDGITVNGVVTGTAMTLTGGSDLTNDVNLKPYVLNNFYDYSVITSAGGNNTISGNVSISPLEVDRVLSTETVDSASIDVDAGSLAITGAVNASLMDMSLNVASGSSLSLQGNSTSAQALNANVATGGSLLLGNTSATNFNANGAGSVEVNGALTTSGAGALGNLTIQSGDLSVTGSVEANGAAIVVGTNTTSGNTATLNIDNSASVLSDRIGDTTDIQLSTGSTLTITGHAADSVAEKAGSLIVDHLNTTYASSRDFVSNVVVNGGDGVTQITFDDLQLASPAGSQVNRIDFATSGSFGGNEKILFSAAPAQVDGLLSNATINGQEFVAYDNSLGIKSATTVTDNIAANGNVLINSATNLAANTTINSLAVTTANVTGAGDITLSSGQMLLSGTSTINPSIKFGAKEGHALVTGSSTLEGGVNGTSGMFVNGGGVLTLAGAGTVTGAVTVNSGDLVLSANDALQGADITVHDGLDIGTTTQNVNSLSTGSGFSGAGSVIAANDISYTSSFGTVDADYQSLNGNVSVYADIMNGNVNAMYESTDNLVGNVVLGSSIDSITMNGDAEASQINAYGTINGNMHASNSVYLYGTSNGLISGTTGLSGYGTLKASNTYTGLTTGTFALRESGSIANSFAYIGSLSMYSIDGGSNPDRIGNSAQINLDATGQTLRLIGSGSESTGIAISEDVGIINVFTDSEVNINIDNSDNGSTVLTADSLALGNNSLVFLSLGDSSRLKFDVVAPATIGATSVINGVYIDKDINGSIMPSWTTYDGVDGVVEASVAESSIAAASAGEFIRVTDAVNSPLNADKSIGAMTVHTTEMMSGTGTLTVETGQIQFWQDNTIDIAQINFGAEQGFMSNAGTNTVNSVLTGANGLRKLGDGKLILGGVNTYTGDTLVTGGEIEVTGSLDSGVNVSNGAGLVVNGGQVDEILSNSGSVSLISASYSASAGQSISGGGSFSLDNASSLSNAGSMYQSVTNSGGVVTNLSTGYISTVNNAAGSSLSSSGGIGNVYNQSGASFTHTTGEVGYLTNSGTYNGTSSSVIGTVSNDSAFTNKGVINDDIINDGDFINNADISLNGSGNSSYYVDTINNNSGATFANNAAISVSQDASVSLDGSFTNNDVLGFQNADNVQSISGSFTNNAAGTVSVIGSTVNLGGTFTNKGSVNIDSTSFLTGSGTYLQQGDAAATTVANGRVETNMEINHGILSGSGYIVGDLIVGPNGTVQPGESPGLLTVEGDFTLEVGADLILEIVGDGSGGYLYDELAVSGNFNILGNIKFDLGAGLDTGLFEPADPETAPVFSLTDFFTDGTGENPSLAAFSNSIIKLEDVNGEVFNMSLIEDGNGGYITEVAPVPVPPAVWLFASGLIGLVGVARRKKAAQLLK